MKIVTRARVPQEGGGTREADISLTGNWRMVHDVHMLSLELEAAYKALSSERHAAIRPFKLIPWLAREVSVYKYREVERTAWFDEGDVVTLYENRCGNADEYPKT